MRLDMDNKMHLSQEGKLKSILVVDDEQIIRDLCSRALQDYQVFQAKDGADALRFLEDTPVDLVLVDVMMPVMNGLEVLQKIKEKDAEQLVVIMTGYSDKDIILRALKADAADFIQKPINLLQLKTSISQALEKKELRQELLQLKQLDRIKSDFLGLISHKLRTPTTSISLFIQNLASGAFDVHDPGFVSALNAIRRESDYLAYLIQDLLYYSDIILQGNSGQKSREDLKEIVMSVLAEKRAAFLEKQQELKSQLTGDWPLVMVDRRRIEFALRGLLDNANKFTQPGGEITLSGKVSKTELSLAVSDNGPGIAPKEITKIFEKFYQIDPNNTGQIRGFGLGLFYVRQFVLDHGGDIEIESVPGQGTTITILLPRQLLSCEA